MLTNTQLQSFLRATKTETVEVLVTSATVFKYNFPIIGNLNNKLITGIELYSQPDATPNNARTVLAADNRRSYVTLINKQDHTQFTRIALIALLQEPGILKQLNFVEIDWENSYLEIIDNPSAPSPAPAGRSFLFGVYYTEKNDRISLMGKANQLWQMVRRMVR
jgi:hypothetical protein